MSSLPKNDLNPFVLVLTEVQVQEHTHTHTHTIDLPLWSNLPVSWFGRIIFLLRMNKLPKLFCLLQMLPNVFTQCICHGKKKKKRPNEHRQVNSDDVKGRFNTL